MTLNQMVGSSSKNSVQLAEVVTSRRVITGDDGKEVVSFRMTVDGVVVKQALFTSDGGRAGDLIKVESFLGERK